MADDTRDEHFLMDCWNYNVFFDNTPGSPAFTSMLQSEEQSALWNSNKFIYSEQIAEPVAVEEVSEGRRSTRVQKTSLGRPLVQDLCKEIMERAEDYILLDPYRYGEKGGVVESIEQPFRIVVHPQVSLICDIHAHLSAAEIIGFLAGKYISETKVLYIQAAIPCTSSEQGGKDVEMDDNAQLRASEIAQKAGFSIVGWYHSHPTFIPNPSYIDLNNHQSISQLTKVGDIEPCVGLIVSTFPKGNTSPIATHEWFTTKFYAGIEHMQMPVRPIVEYPNLQCDDNDAPSFNLASILNSLQENINNSFQGKEDERVVNNTAPAAKNPDPTIVKDENTDIMDVDEPLAPIMSIKEEEEHVKTTTTSNTVALTVSDEDVDYFDEIHCPSTSHEPDVTKTKESSSAEGGYFTKTDPAAAAVETAQPSTPTKDNDCDHHQQIAVDTCDTMTMVSGQSPAQPITCPSTIVASDDSIANGHASNPDGNDLMTQEENTEMAATPNTVPLVASKTDPPIAELRVGAVVRLLDKNSTRSRVPHLINTIGYIREAPGYPKTACFIVEFPAGENKILAFPPSVLQLVDESDQPSTALTPSHTAPAEQSFELQENMATSDKIDGPASFNTNPNGSDLQMLDDNRQTTAPNIPPLTVLKTAPLTAAAAVRVGTAVRLLDVDSTRMRAPHLINTIGYIRQVPIHPSTWYKVEFPADENKVMTFRSSALQLVDLPPSSFANQLHDNKDDFSISDDEIYREPVPELSKAKKGGKRNAAVAEVDPAMYDSRKSRRLEERVTAPKPQKKRGLPDTIEDLPSTSRRGGRRSEADDAMTTIDLTMVRKAPKPSGPRPPSLFTSIVFAINHDTLPSASLARRLLERSPLELRLTAIVVINLVYHYCRSSQRLKLLDENCNKQPKIDKLYTSALSSLERFVFTQPQRREEFAQNLYRFIGTCWVEFSSVTGQLKYKHSESSGGRERPKRLVKPRPQRLTQAHSSNDEAESPRVDDNNGKEQLNNNGNSSRPIRKKMPKRDRD